VTAEKKQPAHRARVRGILNPRVAEVLVATLGTISEAVGFVNAVAPEEGSDIAAALRARRSEIAELIGKGGST
jgi:hypothetical protein